MKLFIKRLSLFMMVIFTLSLSACSKNGGSFDETKGTQYTSLSTNPKYVLVDGSNTDTLTYTYPGYELPYDYMRKTIEEAISSYNVSVTTKSQFVGECTLEDNRYSFDCSKYLASLIIEGENKGTFIDYLEQVYENAFSENTLTEEEKNAYISLLNDKVINVYEVAADKTIIGGSLDVANQTITMDTLTEYHSEGYLWQINKYNSDGKIVYKERYNKDGIIVGVFENYDDGQTKKITWYYDDGSFMNSEEYILENGVKTKAIFKGDDGYQAVEYYKNGVISKLEETYSNGIKTWTEYDKNGDTTRYTAITGGDDNGYTLGLFILNPSTKEFVETESTSYNNNGKLLGRSVSTYDSNFNLTKAICYKANGAVETEEHFDSQGRSVYWYTILEEVIIITKYDGPDYDRYAEAYSLDNTLLAVHKEKNGQLIYCKSLQTDGTWVEEFFD